MKQLKRIYNGLTIVLVLLSWITPFVAIGLLIASDNILHKYVGWCALAVIIFWLIGFHVEKENMDTQGKIQ